MDPLRQRRRLVQRLPEGGDGVLDQGLGGGGVHVDQPRESLEIDRKGNQVLLDAIVEGTLDRASIGVGGLGKTLARLPQFRNLDLQGVDLALVLARASIRHGPTIPSASAGRRSAPHLVWAGYAGC